MMKEVGVIFHFVLLILAVVIFPWKSWAATRGLICILGYVVATILADFFGALIMFQIGPFEGVNNNLFIYHYLTGVQYFSIVGFYYFQLQSQRIKKFIIFSLVAFLGASSVITMFWQPLNDYNSYTSILKYLLTILWTLYYLKEIIVREFGSPILTQPGFWITAGLLVNSLGNLFVEGAANYLISNYGNYFTKIYFIYTLLNYLLSVTFIIAFWHARAQPKYIIRKSDE